MRRGAMILCGGKSSRMGRDKATLPFGPGEVMLQRVVRLVSAAVDEASIVVVAAAGQELPRLPRAVRIVRDRRPQQGPLEGLATGLKALGEQADAVYATSCDVPLLRAAFVERMFELLDGAGTTTGRAREQIQIVVPREDNYYHPLAAVYRPEVLPAAARLLAADRLRPIFLFEECRTREIPVESLRDVDPDLTSLKNCNRPEDYRAALASASFAPDPDVVNWMRPKP